MELHLGGLTVAPNVWQAGAIILLIFIFVLMLAYMARTYMEWSLSGFGIGVVVGIILVIALEVGLLIGGKSVLAGILNWKDAPAPVANVINSGHERLLDVLNVPASCSGNLK